MTTADAYPAELQSLITTWFSRGDLADLCLRLGVHFDSLPNAGLDTQAREFVLLLARRGRLPELLEQLRIERPRVEWPPIPPDYRPPAAAPGLPAPSGGIVIGTIISDNTIVGLNATQNISHGPTFSGDFRGGLLNVQSTLRDARQAIGTLPTADDAARTELIRLVGQLEKALQATPPGREDEAEEVAQMAKELVEAAGAEKPLRSKIHGLGEGLKRAAGALAGALPELLDLTAQIVATVTSLMA